MKFTLFAAILMLSRTCGLFAQDQGNSLRELDWILGTWTRQNSKPGQVQHETWWKISEQHYQGIGMVTAGSDTVFVEKLEIIMQDDSQGFLGRRGIRSSFYENKISLVSNSIKKHGAY
jgi:hypothetical protein